MYSYSNVLNNIACLAVEMESSIACLDIAMVLVKIACLAIAMFQEQHCMSSYSNGLDNNACLAIAMV